jgi:hypothetical protein
MVTKKSIYLFEKYPLTELLRLVNEAIEKGADDFSIEAEDDYGGTDYFIKTYTR